MKKKIALVLVMVILVNSVTWAADDDYDNTDDDWLVPFILVFVAVGLIVSVIAVAVSEADAPDDGIRLASLSNENPIPGSGFGSFLKALNYVEIGQPQNDKIYLGLRFRF